MSTFPFYSEGCSLLIYCKISLADLELENAYRAGREQFQMKGREMVWVFKRNRSRWEEGERKGGRGEAETLSGQNCSWSSDRKLLPRYSSVYLMKCTWQYFSKPSPWHGSPPSVSESFPLNSPNTPSGSTKGINWQLFAPNRHKDEDCVVPVRRHASSGWLGSGLFRIQHSDGPTSGQQTQVGLRFVYVSPRGVLIKTPMR